MIAYLFPHEVMDFVRSHPKLLNPNRRNIFIDKNKTKGGRRFNLFLQSFRNREAVILETQKKAVGVV